MQAKTCRGDLIA